MDDNEEAIAEKVEVEKWKTEKKIKSGIKNAFESILEI